GGGAWCWVSIRQGKRRRGTAREPFGPGGRGSGGWGKGKKCRGLARQEAAGRRVRRSARGRESLADLPDRHPILAPRGGSKSSETWLFLPLRWVSIRQAKRSRESAKIGDSIVLTVVKIHGGNVRLGIEAPSEVEVLRDELISRNRGSRGETRAA